MELVSYVFLCEKKRDLCEKRNVGKLKNRKIIKTNKY